MRLAAIGLFLCRTKVFPQTLQAPIGTGVHFIRARFRQKFSRLSVPPKSVVKFVESTSTMSPARCLFGGIQSRQLNSVLPAAVKGCGRSGSMGWRANKCTDLVSLVVSSSRGRDGGTRRV